MESVRENEYVSIRGKNENGVVVEDSNGPTARILFDLDVVLIPLVDLRPIPAKEARSEENSRLAD